MVLGVVSRVRKLEGRRAESEGAGINESESEGDKVLGITGESEAG